MIDRDKYLNHIQDSNKKFKMKQLIDKIEIVLKNHSIESTDFLDPYEVRLSKSILNRFDDLDYIISGGYKGAERSIVTIYPQYLDRSQIKSDICVLKVDGYLKSISHKDYLGALMNLGIVREKLGDILVYEDYALLIVKDEIKNFVLYNLDKIGKFNVKVKEISIENIEAPKIDFIESKEFIKSLRLDALISAAYNLSRKESKDIINSNKVNCNWEPLIDVSKEIEKGDMISVRGYGRFYLQDIIGKSKKSRYICIIRKLV